MPRLPPQRAFARRPGEIPSEGRTRGAAQARSGDALPKPAAGHGHSGSEARANRVRGDGEARSGDRSREGLARAGARVGDDRRMGRRRQRMAQLSYRDAVAAGIAQEMRRDERVVLFGEDTAAAGGVFKTTVGLFEEFGPRRVKDTPISELAILGAAMGAAMTGLRPVAEIMFSDFLACCWDYVANEIAKTRYMSDGQITIPLVIRTANGAGSRFGAQHSQSVENWAMAIPGLKVVAPSTPADVKGLLAAAIRDPDPVVFFEHKALYATKGEVPDGEHVDKLGTAVIRRHGSDLTIAALALMVPRALEAAERLQAEHGISATVIDVRSLVPLDTQTIFAAVSKTGRFYTVEENPRLCGWGAEIASLVAEERFWDLDAPITRFTTPHVPFPAADRLEDLAIRIVPLIVDTILKTID